MGPRFFKRGDNEHLGIIFNYEVASMGPRFFKRGDFVTDAASTEQSAELQWGHASSSVEIS
jgi:hypothetical protein